MAEMADKEYKAAINRRTKMIGVRRCEEVTAPCHSRRATTPNMEKNEREERGRREG